MRVRWSGADAQTVDDHRQRRRGRRCRPGVRSSKATARAVDEQTAEALAAQGVDRGRAAGRARRRAPARVSAASSSASARVLGFVVGRARRRRPLAAPAPACRSRPAAARPRAAASRRLVTTSAVSRTTSMPQLVQIGAADAGEQQPHVVVHLGHRADRGARIADAVLLADGDGRGDALDAIDVGLLHPLEELPRIGRQRLHVAPLPLGVDGVEGERRLARPAHAGEHHQLAGGQGEVDVLEVVGTSPANDDGLGRPGGWHGAWDGALRRAVGSLQTPHGSAPGAVCALGKGRRLPAARPENWQPGCRPYHNSRPCQNNRCRRLTTAAHQLPTIARRARWHGS